MKKLTFFFTIFSFALIVKGQDPNILIGLNDAYGIKIKANFPGQTTPWARGYYIVNQDNTNNLLGLGVMGSVINGVSTIDFGWIGKDYNNVYMSFRPNGNVGVGTTTPNAKFVVSNEGIQSIEMGYSGSLSANYIESINRNANSGMDMAYYISDSRSHRFYNNAIERLRITGDGNVGIGTTNPISKLDVSGSINITDGENITWGGNYNQGMPTIASSLTAGINFYPTGSTLGSMMKISPNGNVLIGKISQTNTTYKLDINGKARANEIVVNTTGADFVFENNYKLRPLAEVESFVKQNKHLPEIPTAKTMQAEGVGVSELQTKLLQKVEELTLYIIQQQKEIDELKKKLNK